MPPSTIAIRTQHIIGTTPTERAPRTMIGTTSPTHDNPDTTGISYAHDDNIDLRNGIDAGDPVTATGRTKKRQRDKEVFDPDDPDRYRYKAYHIRRAFDLFGHIPTIINDGIKRNAKEMAGAQDASDIQSDRDFETFNLILNHLDGLKDDIVRLKRNPKAFRSLVRKIREAADQARNNDTANLKKDIACMLTPDGSSVLFVGKGKRPSSKHDRGFDNEIMGRHLCPISLDWDNEIVRTEIRQGKHAILACDWPRLLYADCDCNLDDLELGLGRNMALVCVVKYLFTGRSAAFSETPGGKTTRSGNAALAGMKEVTPRVVAYAACMLRYAISNEESWSSIDNEFNTQEFYWHVVSIFDDSDDFGKELLTWWNLKVFGTSVKNAKTSEVSSKNVTLSLLQRQREMKRVARRTLGDVTNQLTTHRERDLTPESEDDSNLNHTEVPFSRPFNPPQHSDLHADSQDSQGVIPTPHVPTQTSETRGTRSSQTAQNSQPISVHSAPSGSPSNQAPRHRYQWPTSQYSQCTDVQYPQLRALSPSAFHVPPTSIYSPNNDSQRSQALSHAQNRVASSGSHLEPPNTLHDQTHLRTSSGLNDLMGSHQNLSPPIHSNASTAGAISQPPPPPWYFSSAKTSSSSASLDASALAPVSKSNATP